MDNAMEFRSHAFEDYCVATGITLTYSVPYEHFQNGLAEAFIKKVQLVIRPLLLQAQLPSSMWGHVVLHATALLKVKTNLTEHPNTSRTSIWAYPRRVTYTGIWLSSMGSCGRTKEAYGGTTAGKRGFTLALTHR